MKEIALTKSKVTIVDDGDFEGLNKYKWCANKIGNTHYAVRRSPREKSLLVYMHRVILSAPVGLQVDHINHNGLDNCRCNLRLCTHAENQRNSPLRKDSTSGYKGVCWLINKNKYQAKIYLNRKQICLGSFDCPVEAAKAYNAKAKELFGEFAKLNIIKEN